MKPAPAASDHDDVHIEVGEPKTWAAGLPAVIETARQVGAQMGWRKGARTLLRLNQPDGFDCPGCAWPEPHHTSRVEFCENGAKAVAEEATDRRITPAFFAEHSIASLAGETDYWLGQQGRLTTPMHRPPGATHYVPIDWDAAIARIGAALATLASPHRAVFYTSGRTSNEAAFVYQLMVRALGTNNLPDCSNMCHESSGVALGRAIGIGKGTVTLDDIHAAELILVVGQNPGTNHPRMLSALERAKRNGASIVAINPLPEAGLLAFRNPQRVSGVLGRGTALADLHLPIMVGADLALFQLLNRRLVHDDNALDRAFVDAYCDGFDELSAHLDALDPDVLLAATGLDRDAVDELYRRVAGRERIIICWAMGLTQHRQAVATIQELTNTLLLRGAIGKPGAGACPVRGHSNVQGDRTMGIFEKPPAGLLDALEERFGFAPPRQPGFDTVDALGAMHRGDVDVFVGLGGNLVAAAPDTDVAAAAMERCALTVQVSTKLNRSHVRCGAEAIILPCLGRTERDEAGAGSGSSRWRTRWAWSTPAEAPTARRRRSSAARSTSCARSRRPRSASTPSTGAHWPPTTTPSATTSPPSSRGATTTTGGCANRAGSPCPTARATGGSSPPTRGWLGSPSTASTRWSCRRDACCCRRCARTTSTTPRSTGSTTATAASSRVAAWCS